MTNAPFLHNRLSLLATLILTSTVATGYAAVTENAADSTSVHSAVAKPQTSTSGAIPDMLTAERIAASPQRAAWEAYIQRSNAFLQAEIAQLRTEAKDGPTQKAPSTKDFKMKPQWDDAWFASAEAKQITDAMLSFQTPTGGWSKAVSYSKGPRVAGMQWTSQTEPFHYAATFDNRATTEQLSFLNRVWRATGRADVKAALERGLDFVFSAQYPNGGWPQNYPIEGGYHDAITFNDNAMIHILELLANISQKTEWSWLDDARREKAKSALDAGVKCVLQAQYQQGGVKTVWCAQHDPLTLAPVAARLKEPASLSGGESGEIVRFLMNLPEQTPAVIASIEAALVWFEKTKITDLRRVTENGKTTYAHQAEPQAPIWARFYDLKTNKPVFAGAQDAIIYESYAEMAAHNHFGYDYFVSKPVDLLTKEQVKWRKRLARQ